MNKKGSFTIPFTSTLWLGVSLIPLWLGVSLIHWVASVIHPSKSYLGPSDRGVSWWYTRLLIEIRLSHKWTSRFTGDSWNRTLTYKNDNTGKTTEKKFLKSLDIRVDLTTRVHYDSIFSGHLKGLSVTSLVVVLSSVSTRTCPTLCIVVAIKLEDSFRFLGTEELVETSRLGSHSVSSSRQTSYTQYISRFSVVDRNTEHTLRIPTTLFHDTMFDPLSFVIIR